MTDMIQANNKAYAVRTVTRILGLLVLTVPALGMAAGGGSFMQPVKNDVGDIASLQRGARNFVNYCAGCHSAKYIRYSKLQEVLQLTDEQMTENLMFAARKTDELMKVAMPAEDAARWFGLAPPDLTLVARSRGTEWVYNFLKTFYLDPRRPTGVNNLMLPNASMPHVLWQLQGTQTASFYDTTEADGTVVTHFGDPAFFAGFEQATPGKLTPEEYDLFVTDLVNFLDWAGTPERLAREHLGYWVIIFLIVFLLFAYLLKVEIWKDVK
jgi:ubiquinol-cytochrome c reductase cytochrome c1 subunit